MRTQVKPAACAHIAAYYHLRWEAHPCIAFNMLRQGYRHWSEGYVQTDINNLFESEAVFDWPAIWASKGTE